MEFGIETTGYHTLHIQHSDIRKICVAMRAYPRSIHTKKKKWKILRNGCGDGFISVFVLILYIARSFVFFSLSISYSLPRNIF